MIRLLLENEAPLYKSIRLEALRMNRISLMLNSRKESIIVEQSLF